MSKLYLDAETDMIKTSRTARANNWITVRLGYDEGDYSKKFIVNMIRKDTGEVDISLEKTGPSGRKYVGVCRIGPDDKLKCDISKEI